MTRITIVSGAGRYADPWHSFAQTTTAVAQLLGEFGRVDTRDDVDAALGGLGVEAERPDLLVLNIGNPSDDSPSTDAAEGLIAYLHAGGPLLALHSSSTTFVGWQRWGDILGGRWMRDASYHPSQHTSRVSVVPGPVTEGLDVDFEVNDEFYKSLQVSSGVHVLATHRFEGVVEPITWAHEFSGARVVYDALGHDATSYRSRGRASLLLAEVDWLLAGTNDRPPPDSAP